MTSLYDRRSPGTMRRDLPRPVLVLAMATQNLAIGARQRPHPENLICGQIRLVLSVMIAHVFIAPLLLGAKQRTHVQTAGPESDSSL
jgi:hypothetical protein